ncbi:MAG: S8 family serine peptidase [Chloroflexi bacterium]|nr:S8 family serine peptidase [Chloroflexota bacterium]
MARRVATTYILLAAIIFAIITLLSSASAADATPPDFSQREISLIVHTAKPYGNIIDSIQSLGGTVTVQYENADAVAARIPVANVPRLLALRGVIRVQKDRIIQLPGLLEDHMAARALKLPASQILDPAATASKIGEVPESYFSYLTTITGAKDIWPETGAGANSIVAVIDTGTDAGHTCLSGRDGQGLPASRVIAGPDLSTDAGTPFEGSTLVSNASHGTFVAGLIASRCFIVLDRAIDSDAALIEIFEAHLPEDAFYTSGRLVMMPLVGIAPSSSIYAVKVFPHAGGGASLSIIEAALDHVITRKKLANSGAPGGLDIDVVNMSLGGAALYDGNTLEEQLVDAATEAGMLVVVAAGNDGPAPVSVSTPGTAFTALTAGAASDHVHSRIFWDLFFGPGQGLAMYPDEEIRPADFSGRGPLGDNRPSPDVLANGVFNLSLQPGGGTGFGSGTSFSAPVVAGGAALLSVWAKANDPAAGVEGIRRAIINGATPLSSDFSRQEQGSGFLNVAAALDRLKEGVTGETPAPFVPSAVQPNIQFQDGVFTSTFFSLAPSRGVDFIFEILPATTIVTVAVNNVTIDPNPVPAVLPNSIELYIKGAKRGGTGYIVYSANVFGHAAVIIGDGYVNIGGAISGAFLNASTFEPGLMKVTLQGDWTNNGNVAATVTIRRFDDKQVPDVQQRIGPGATVSISVDIPAGATEAVFELGWEHNWSRFPTNDLDMILCAPGSVLFPDFSGATLNSPERIVVQNPQQGTWQVAILGFGVFTPDDGYYLDVKVTVPGVNPPGVPATQRIELSTPQALHNRDGQDHPALRGALCV